MFKKYGSNVIYTVKCYELFLMYFSVDGSWMITKRLLQVALASSTAARTDLKVARSHPLIILSDIRQISIACFTRLSANPTKSSS